MENVLNMNNYSEDYNTKLIELSFKYFDTQIDKEKFENDAEIFIREFNNYKPVDTKLNFKLFVEFIEKNSSLDENILNENLKSISKWHN